jgi:SAM-dependent methyltransferase
MSADRPVFTDGANYERFMGRWSARVGTQFLDWLEQPAGLRWVDVGCGNGAFTEQIVTRRAPASVHALDPSEGQLEFARRRNGVTNVQFLQGDAQALPFASAAFDVAAMALVISFVPDQARGVAEMRRVVRPGGCVSAYIWDVAGGGLPVQPLMTAMQTVGIVFPTLGETGTDHLRALWRGAGLESIETQVLRISVEFDDFDDFWVTNTASGTPIGAALARASADDRQRSRALLQESVPLGDDGRISYGAHANAIKGRVPT